MRSGLLRAHVAALRLNPQAPFPSMIARRLRYRMRGLRSVTC